MWLITAALSAAVLNGSAIAAPARTTVPLATADVRLGETAIGDLVADAILRAGKADLALVNAAQFRPGSVGPGKVNAADVAALLVKPDREWVVSSITGKAIRLAIERSLSRVPEASAHFLQVSGLRVRYDPKALSGHRVESLQIGTAPAQPTSMYRVAMPEDLAKGGSGYFTVPEINETTIVPEATGTLAEAITQLLEQTPELDYADLDRIVPANGPAPGAGE
jgi:5'-nucleotidase/UDP-sugar diphosphatase